jgi:DNA-binding GntR family transcriptional regulator
VARLIEEAAGEAPGRVPPLVVQIADQIERDIIAGRYRPGERLREQEIASRLQTSRGPVREALRLAELSGFVELTPWRGANVVDLGMKELEELLEILGALQGLVCRLAAMAASEDELARVSSLVDQMDATLTDPTGMPLQLRLAFQAGALLRISCRSDRAGGMLLRVGRLAYWQHAYLLSASPAWRKRAVAKWRVLAAALQARQPQASERASRAIVADARLEILRGAKLHDAPPVPADLPDNMDTEPSGYVVRDD